MLSHLWLFATPWTVACQAPLSMGFSKQEYWSGLPFPLPRDLLDSGIKPAPPLFPALQAYFLPVESSGSKDCNGNSLETSRASLVAQLVKNPPAMRETWVRSLGWEDPLQGERLPTPVFWPGESHGLYSPWGPKESDMAEWLSLSLWRHLRKMFFSSKKREQCAGNLFPSMWPRHLCTEAAAGSYGNHPGNKEKSLETQRNHPRDWCYGVSKLASPQPASLQISHVWFITKSRLSLKKKKKKKNCQRLRSNSSSSSPVWRKGSTKEFRTLSHYRLLSHLWPCVAFCISASHPPPPEGADM